LLIQITISLQIEIDSKSLFCQTKFMWMCYNWNQCTCGN